MREILIKCKPVYNFQSVEYEYIVDLDNEECFNEMFDFYDKMLTGLQAIAPEQQKVQGTAPKSVSKEPMSTINQQNYLEGLGIPKEESRRMTKKQASDMIKELS